MRTLFCFLCSVWLCGLFPATASADPLNDLREAVLASDADGVRKALSEGADVNARIENKRGRSALIAAAEKGDAELVKLLLEAGANIEFATKRGRRQ